MPGREDVRPGWNASAAPRQNTPRVKLTYDDFLLCPDDGKRHELIDGEHYVTPAPNIRHQQLLKRLLVRIDNWLAQHPLGEVFCAPLDVRFSKFDVVEPDVLYVSNQRRAILEVQFASGAPDLVVEIGSPSTRRRDETIKRRLYEQFNVSEYWIVDPETDAIRIHRRTGERFAKPIKLSRENSDVLTTPLLPGLEIPLASLFED
jgi:Uma2 family endonuclease